VTSLNRAEAANFGRDEHMGHDARYDRADEFMEVVLGHWNTWEDDALILDKANSRFADPAKVHRLDHGPVLPVARPVQRAAVAAGPSGADPGRAVRPGPVFAAKWAEIVFVIHHSLEDAKREYASFKAAVAAAGRDPARVHVAPACYVCVGETETVAQEKRAVIEATARGVDALVLLSEVLNLACRARMMMWCGCWCPSCNAAVCSKRIMSARHCATIWDWRYPGPPIGTRRAERLCDDKLCRCAILRHTHRVPSI
jgi:alkanesulfonate monooxygenase SsuD/methylene tetrahydromethanopterin reductase-like flavin-dependent oxidoreductase (luciferase family)